MLPAQKEDKRIEAVPFSPDLMLSPFGKVVGSIEGLRHKLDDLTISDIEETQEKVKTLGLRLEELQRTLERLWRIQGQLIKAETEKAHAEAETPDFTELESAQTAVQLHTLGQLRNLILFPRVHRGGTNAQEKSSKANNEACDNKAPAEPNPSTTLSGAEEVFSPDSRSTDPSPESTLESSVHERDNEGLSKHSADQEPEQATLIPDDLAGGESASQQQRPQQSEEPAAQPVEAKKDEGPLKQFDEAKIEWRDTPEAAGTAPSESRIASQFEFDQRLLNDLIKDYGEFVIPSPSSTPAEPARPANDAQSAPQTEVEFPLVENVSIQKPLPGARKDGDLDRKLKKLIKDYGEYDLYSDQTSKKYRAGVIAALVILGVVFGGIYFLLPSRDESVINPLSSSPGIQSDRGPASESDHTSTRDAGTGDGSKAASGNERDNSKQSDQSVSRGSINKLPANKNTTNNEKVGK